MGTFPAASEVLVINYRAEHAASEAYLSGSVEAMFSHFPSTWVDRQRPFADQTMFSASLLYKWQRPTLKVWMTTRCGPDHVLGVPPAQMAEAYLAGLDDHQVVAASGLVFFWTRADIPRRLFQLTPTT
eukprot:1174118-Pyramimonas_sp.AAC.1